MQGIKMKLMKKSILFKSFCSLFKISEGCIEFGGNDVLDLTDEVKFVKSNFLVSFPSGRPISTDGFFGRLSREGRCKFFN